MKGLTLEKCFGLALDVGGVQKEMEGSLCAERMHETSRKSDGCQWMGWRECQRSM